MLTYVRTFADLMHLLSFVIILYKLLKQKNCKGVSLKTQEIYLVVFCCRYLDLFMYYINLYNTTMKIAFLSATSLIVFLMRFKKPIYQVTTNKLIEFRLIIVRTMMSQYFIAFFSHFWQVS